MSVGTRARMGVCWRFTSATGGTQRWLSAALGAEGGPESREEGLLRLNIPDPKISRGQKDPGQPTSSRNFCPPTRGHIWNNCVWN